VTWRLLLRLLLLLLLRRSHAARERHGLNTCVGMGGMRQPGILDRQAQPDQLGIGGLRKKHAYVRITAAFRAAHSSDTPVAQFDCTSAIQRKIGGPSQNLCS